MAGDQMKQRRDTAAGWNTNNRVLGAGEFGLETDTRKVKFGDGITPWNALSYINYLPLDGKAANADKLDGFDSTEFVLGIDATTAATANKVARRLSDGRLKAATATEDDDLVTFLQAKSGMRYRGIGGTLPSTDLRVGDTYWHTTYGMLMYIGSVWKQPYAFETTEASRIAMATSGTAAAPLYIGYEVFETDTLRKYMWAGSAVGWDYLGGGLAPSFRLPLNTTMWRHWVDVNPPAQGQSALEPLQVVRQPGRVILLTGLVQLTQTANGNTWYQLVNGGQMPTWALPLNGIAQSAFLNITNTSGPARIDVCPPNAPNTVPARSSIGFYCVGSVGSGTLVNINITYNIGNNPS